MLTIGEHVVQCDFLANPAVGRKKRARGFGVDKSWAKSLGFNADGPGRASAFDFGVGLLWRFSGVGPREEDLMQRNPQ